MGLLSDDDSDKDFTPQQVWRLRELLGFTQREAAARFGVALNTWSRWEIGAIKVHRARTPQLRQLLNELETRQSQQLLKEDEKYRQIQQQAKLERARMLAAADEDRIINTYRFALDAGAAHLHELNSWAAGAVELESWWQEVMGLKNVMLRQTQLLEMLTEKAKHRTKFEEMRAQYSLDSDKKLRVRHADQLRRSYRFLRHAIPRQDPLWLAVYDAKELLREAIAEEFVDVWVVEDSR